MKTPLYTKIIAILGIVIASFPMYSQCAMDRHNTTWYDGWVSCDKKASPNPIRGNCHWLMYSLGYQYKLGKTYWWNHNVPYSLSNGAKTVAIDYSLDGVTWTEWGTTSLDKASGLNHYEGAEGIDFGGIIARFVLITVVDNYGGKCAGISEVKIDVDFVSSTDQTTTYQQCVQVEAYPLPFTQVLKVDITNLCNKASELFLTDVTGRRILEQSGISGEKSSIELNTRNLPVGLYTINVVTGNKMTQHKVVKME